MKKLFLLSMSATLICTITFAKIWRVNNNVGITADFTTAQAANDHSSVLAGDTIHLEPSITSYGNLDCTKRLVWISTGAFLGIHPNEQFSPNAGRVEYVNAIQPTCANSVFHIYVNSTIIIEAPGVRIDRCFAAGQIITNDFGFGTPNNVVIINSYSKSDLNLAYGSSILATNNIFEGSLNVSGNVALAVITHNVFNATSAGVGNVENSMVENNIFNKAVLPITFTNSTVRYNMSSAVGVLPAGNNNQNGVAMNTVLVDDNGTDDAAFVLKAGSPAIGAGSGTPAVNLGAFGGGSPFKLALQPSIPAIYKIQAPAAPAGNTMNVTFSTKSNN